MMKLNKYSMILLITFFVFTLQASFRSRFVPYNAGIFPYAKHDGNIWFLLGEEARWGGYNDFGGKADKADKNDTKMTAAREFVEETNYIYGQKEAIYPKVDEQFGFGDRNIYRTYLLEVPYKTIPDIKKRPKHKDSDKSNYTWVLAKDLLDNVANSTDDNAVFVDDYEGRSIKIFHRFVWILRQFNNEIRNIIGLSLLQQIGQLPGIQPQAFIEKQGNKYAVDSVSVLPYAFNQNKIFFLLGSDALGINYYLMYFDFGSLVYQNAFVGGIFDPLISAAYGFQKVRDLFGDDSIGFIKNAIIRSNETSIYDALEKHLMFLANINYKVFDSSNYPCQWVDAEDFLNWIKRTHATSDEHNIPLQYGKLPIYQPFAARLKRSIFQIEKIINEAKNKYLIQQRVGNSEVMLKDSLIALHNKLNQLQVAL